MCACRIFSYVLGGKSPNIFMADVLDEDDAFFDKALEGFTLFAFNKGEAVYRQWHGATRRAALSTGLVTNVNVTPWLP